MKITNAEAIQAQQALSKLIEVKLPVKVSLDIALISNRIDERVKAFASVRDRLYKTYSVNTEKGEVENTIRFVCSEEGKEEENLQAFMEEFNELLDTRAEDLEFKKIVLPGDIEIEPSILVALTKFIEVE